MAAGPPRRVRPRRSVGGFAYSAGGAAELSRNPVLGGAGHRGGNLVRAVGRRPGVGARAAGEGTWRGTERRRGGVGTRTETEVLRRDAGARWAVNPSMLCHAGGCSHYRDYPVCRFYPSVDKTGGVGWKKVSELSLF